MCCGGNISHLWPVHSITGRGCFSGLYIITHVLFIFLRSMVMQRVEGWGSLGDGGCEQDGCHRQVNLSTAEQRQEGKLPPSLRFAGTETWPVAFPLSPFMAPICCALLRLKFTPETVAFL